VTVEELPSRSICRVEPMNMSLAYRPAVCAAIRFERIVPSGPTGKISGCAAQ
jgi:hypothetical protein